MVNLVAKEVAAGLLVAAVGGGLGGEAFVHHPPVPSSSSSHHRRRVIARAQKDEVDRSDFPAWVKALTRWDASDEPPVATTTTSKPEGQQGVSFASFPFVGNRRSGVWEDEMGPEVASLSGMVNVEALVAAANETEEEMDMLWPNIDGLIQTIDADAEFSWKVGKNDTQQGASSSTKQLFPFLDNELLRWDEFIPLLKRNVELLLPEEDGNGMNITFEELVNLVPSNPELLADGIMQQNDTGIEPSSGSNFDTAAATEKILQDAASRLEFLLNGTSSAFSPSTLQSLILRASNALAIQEASGNLTAAAYEIFQRAGEGPRATAEYTADLVQFANGVLAGGYAPLFENYPSVKSIPAEEQGRKIVKPAEFASLAGAIYEDAMPEIHELGHAMVAQGKTADIGWMVTDSVQHEGEFRSDVAGEGKPTLVRTIVLRGYDASDDEVDREGLLNVVCTASPVPILNKEDRALVRVHEGMLSLAQELMAELEQYIDMTPPSHKLVFTGHSIGGSLAILLMILLANDRGAEFVKDKILRVFSFGSPPIFEIESTSNLRQIASEGSGTCSILDAFGLPTDIVYGFNQPWDPIVRLFSSIDPLYPLIDDLGEDGYTPWVSGPSRTLRPIVKTILESWEGWPQYRENARVKLGQDYRSIGEQFLLLPEPIRYLTDRLVSVNTAVPPIDSMVSISNRELLPALADVFTLDTFRISYVSVAIRSFVHHFYPAYAALRGSPAVENAERVREETTDDKEKA